LHELAGSTPVGKGSRAELRDATGATMLPTLKLAADGTVITHSRAILSWIGRQA
jgi:hypothetical protein